jgi:PTS system nitrogen regulatory IIA component
MNEHIPFADLIKKGGVVYNVPGHTPQEVLSNLINALVLPPELDKASLLKAVLERESLMSTATGHGIALPHPRNQLVSKPQDQFVVIAYLEQQADWSSLDAVPVKTLFLVVSSSAKSHLHTLSYLHFFCQQESFRALLQNHASGEEIVGAMTAIEEEWK